MLSVRKFTLLCLAAAACLPLAGHGAPSVLDEPARMSRLAAVSPVTAVAVAGERFVAVGPRGHVLLSSSEGWTQVATPTSADLTAVHFVSADLGWAVGHGAVILHTQDGGKTWTRQLDGREVARLMVDHYQQAVARGEDKAKEALAEAQRMQADGPGRPLLSVWFRDSKAGFAVGAFNLILKTSDGGAHWEPWFHRTENPQLKHLTAIVGDSRRVYVVGEQGLLLRLSDDGERFEAMPSPYKGSFFGALIPEAGSLLVFGMRGNAFVTSNDGAHWARVETGDVTGLTAGTVLAGGGVALVTQSGQVLVYRRGHARMEPQALGNPMPYAGIAATPGGSVALVGMGGARTATMLRANAVAAATATGASK